MEEVLGQFLVNVAIEIRSASSVTTNVEVDTRDLELIVIKPVHLAGKIKDYSADLLNMEEEPDFLGNLKMVLVGMEEFQDVKQSMVKEIARNGEQ